MAVNAAQSQLKTVGDPNAAYESLAPLWKRARAVCSGERYVKDLDRLVNVNNMLIPFSPSMTQEQYIFYKAEAELPGITGQFYKMLIGGLLRKKPELTFSPGVPAEAMEWIFNNFGADDASLTAFLDAALFEEIQTSRAWVFVDYPRTDGEAELAENLKPYPVLHTAESIINWRTSVIKGKTVLDRIIVRGFVKNYLLNEFHPTYVDTVWVHELDASGFYQIREFQSRSMTSMVPVVAGQTTNPNVKYHFVLEDTVAVVVQGNPLPFIPAWPLNGSVEALEPMLSQIIDKEVHLYNKLSRRNHLLYGAATYTPVLFTDMSDDQFDQVVGAGLGSWLKLGTTDKAEMLETPSAALADYDRAIAASIEEMAKMGIRMLTPEGDQSGVALEIRNAAQTAQLGTLNNKISTTMRQIITFMLNWRYDLQLTIEDVQFSLSADFDPVPLGADWLRLATEWYEGGFIPRSVWLQILKANDMVPPDYNDQKGQLEINADTLIMPRVDHKGEDVGAAAAKMEGA